MEQVVYTFLGKKNTNGFVAIKSDFVFSSIITTNIQKTLQPINTGAEHTYIISKHGRPQGEGKTGGCPLENGTKNRKFLENLNSKA